jgi:hypothetical protein
VNELGHGPSWHVLPSKLVGDLQIPKGGMMSMHPLLSGAAAGFFNVGVCLSAINIQIHIKDHLYFAAV